MIYIILIGPENPGNTGAICRAMKNFGLNNLVLINPVHQKLHKDAIARAKHALPILKKAKISSISFLKKMDMIIGTTSKLGTDYNIPRTPVKLEEAISKIISANSSNKPKIAIVFGRESIGLTNKEIEMCDFITTIPTSPKYKPMNISHAATIIFYELFKQSKESKKTLEAFEPASQKEKQVLLSYAQKILNRMEFSTPEKKKTQEILWKRLIGKANLSKREAFALCGFFRKVLKKNALKENNSFYS